MGSAVHSWFNLKPSGSAGSVDIVKEMNDYGTFCMECSMMVLADDPTPPPPCSYNFCCFCLFYWLPFFKMLCESDITSRSLAECLTVTLCVHAGSSTQTGFLSCYCACRRTVFLNYLSVLCQNLVLPPLSLPYTRPETSRWEEKSND